jgi:hypothetical protein
MTEDKDVKRLVHRRMRKTGESCTTARSHFVARGGVVLPVGYADLAGMSDEAVSAKTGRSWPAWVQVLDDIGGRDKPHREIAAWLRKHEELGAWWSQTVTVGYERIRGLREIGQRSDGTYEATKSKTFASPIAKVYEAFSTKRGRAGWLDEAGIKVRKLPDKATVGARKAYWAERLNALAARLRDGA